MNIHMRVFLLALMLTAPFIVTNAQKVEFKKVIDLPATSVKSQGSTGTCWNFATTSFFESELLRMGKGEFDLSEMFVVRYNYITRLNDNRLRKGEGNISQGSLSHDWTNVFKKYGMVPNEVYTGLKEGVASHNHGALNAYLGAINEASIEKRDYTKEYSELINSILDIYLGKVPETFTYKGKEYTPKSFAESLELNMDDYVEIGSYSHHPFYETFSLEVPDNWTHSAIYNVPLNELMDIINYSFEQGYTVNWDGDVSESGFGHSKGYAKMPKVISKKIEIGTDQARFDKDARKKAQNQKDVVAKEELFVTQENRQVGFETFKTTDDHLMHLTGVSKDKEGVVYYKTKNSWGTSNLFDGYLYMSEQYVKAKTIFIMVHKDAIPAEIKTKMGI